MITKSFPAASGLTPTFAIAPLIITTTLGLLEVTSIDLPTTFAETIGTTGAFECLGFGLVIGVGVGDFEGDGVGDFDGVGAAILTVSAP